MHLLSTHSHGFGSHVEVKKLRGTLYRARSERSARLQDHLELELEELEAAATEDELAAEKAAGKVQTMRSFEHEAARSSALPIRHR